MIAPENTRRVWRSAEIPVTSTRDSLEHLVREEGDHAGERGPLRRRVRTLGASGGACLSPRSPVPGLRSGPRRQGRTWPAPS